MWNPLRWLLSFKPKKFKPTAGQILQLKSYVQLQQQIQRYAGKEWAGHIVAGLVEQRERLIVRMLDGGMPMTEIVAANYKANSSK